MEVKPMKTAVVGCGVISDIYMQSLQERFKITELVACYDRNDYKMQEKANKYGIQAMSYEEILNDPAIEMIVNLTTPVSHYSITKQALEHGKHVFSEKMLCLNPEEGKELCALAKEKGLRLGVAPDTFLGGSIQTARYIVDKGLIGTPLSAVVSLNRNFDVYGDILPHLFKHGGTMPYDVGCYYMTALGSILGPATRISAMGRCFRQERMGKRVDKPWLEEMVRVEDYNIMTANVEYENGVICSVHFNSESIIDECPHLEIYGTDGILVMGDPNQFGSPVYVKKAMGEMIKFPFTHGFTENSRGLGAAEMAWSIRKNRPHRASMEMAYHVFEMIYGMYQSAHNGKMYEMESSFEKIKALPEGYIGNGFWGPTEESALVF